MGLQPARSQVLRGPLPSLAEISCDWAHLWELEILPGLSDPTSAKGEHKLQTVKRTLAPPAAVRRDTSQAGELFTSADPIPGRVKTVRWRARALALHLERASLPPLAVIPRRAGLFADTGRQGCV